MLPIKGNITCHVEMETCQCYEHCFILIVKMAVVYLNLLENYSLFDSPLELFDLVSKMTIQTSLQYRQIYSASKTSGGSKFIAALTVIIVMQFYINRYHI